MPRGPIYRIVYQIEVFSEGPPPIGMSPTDIEYEISHGTSIGDFDVVSTEIVPPEEVVDHLLRIGNDGSFFDPLDDEVED